MRNIFTPASLILAALLLSACDDGATRQTDLPAGQAPAAAPQPQVPAQVPADVPEPAPQAQAETEDPPAPQPPDALAPAGQRTQGSGFSYELPAGWTVGPARQMRVLTLIAPADMGGGELAVAHWPNGVGTYHSNIVRWAREVGLTPADAAKLDGLDLIEIGGAESRWQALVNPDADKALLSVWVPRLGEEVYTIKYPATPGPVAQVEAAADTVRRIVESIEFE